MSVTSLPLRSLAALSEETMRLRMPTTVSSSPTIIAAATPSFSAVEAPMRRVLKYDRSEEPTSELKSLMRQSYDVFCLKKKEKIFHQAYDCKKREDVTPQDSNT